MPCFVWDSKEGRVVHALDRALLVVGRDAVSDIIVLEPAVSRRHALVQVDGDKVMVTDLGSSSGTKINGARLTPDLPSTLADGDMMQLGRVVFTYHAGDPPPAPLALDPEPTPEAPPRKKGPPPPRVPRTPPRSPARKPAAAGGPPWKWIALASAFLMVGMAGALIAVLTTRDDKPVQPPVVSRPPDPVVEEPVPPSDEPEPPDEGVTEDEPEEKPDDKRAPEGELPPQGFLSVADFPDLIEINGESYYPVSLRDWNGTRITAVGADGRTYSIRQSEVTKSEDRVDLARRAARARQRLDPEDADALRELARWCARRYIKRETRLLATRLLELRPGDAEATELLRLTE